MEGNGGALVVILESVTRSDATRCRFRSDNQLADLYTNARIADVNSLESVPFGARLRAWRVAAHIAAANSTGDSSCGSLTVAPFYQRRVFDGRLTARGLVRRSRNRDVCHPERSRRISPTRVTPSHLRGPSTPLGMTELRVQPAHRTW